MCEDNWTNAEEERQDNVDNAIYNLILELSPLEEDGLEWNIEEIGEVRDVIQEILVNKHKVMTEQEFYPYRELEPEPQPEPEEFIISDQFGKITYALEDCIRALDAQEFADLVGELFGGECRYIGEYKYVFFPNSDYQGGLDDIKEEENG